MKATKIANRVVRPGVRALVNASGVKVSQSVTDTLQAWRRTASNANSPSLTKYLADPRAEKPATWS